MEYDCSELGFAVCDNLLDDLKFVSDAWPRSNYQIFYEQNKRRPKEWQDYEKSYELPEYKFQVDPESKFTFLPNENDTPFIIDSNGLNYSLPAYVALTL